MVYYGVRLQHLTNLNSYIGQDVDSYQSESLGVQEHDSKLVSYLIYCSVESCCAPRLKGLIPVVANKITHCLLEQTLLNKHNNLNMNCSHRISLKPSLF